MYCLRWCLTLSFIVLRRLHINSSQLTNGLRDNKFLLQQNLQGYSTSQLHHLHNTIGPTSIGQRTQQLSGGDATQMEFFSAAYTIPCPVPPLRTYKHVTTLRLHNRCTFHRLHVLLLIKHLATGCGQQIQLTLLQAGIQQSSHNLTSLQYICLAWYIGGLPLSSHLIVITHYVQHLG